MQVSFVNMCGLTKYYHNILSYLVLGKNWGDLLWLCLHKACGLSKDNIDWTEMSVEKKYNMLVAKVGRGVALVEIVLKINISYVWWQHYCQSSSKIIHGN